MGLSVLVPREAQELHVTVRWGDYQAPTPAPAAAPPDLFAPAPDRVRQGELFGDAAQGWRRRDRVGQLALKLPASQKPIECDVPGGGLKVALAVRPVKDLPAFGDAVPRGARSVSVFLVNRRPPAPDETRDTAFAFQAALEVRCARPFVPRPNLRGLVSDDWDERVADLQYRDVGEFAVGHGVATRAVLDDRGDCREVHTRWIPAAEVERVAPTPIDGVERAMERLAELPDGAAARAALEALVTRYRAWIAGQRDHVPAEPACRRETGEELLSRAAVAADRIAAGIALLADPVVLDAFRTANRVMAAAARRRGGALRGLYPAALPPPLWRPFQLAFLLMNLPAVVEPTHPDRGVVDLLFFPTGGGKTEAYLGLAAFTLVHRRLRYPALAGAGGSVLMRYTLRLLTLDQLGRAATLICALECERWRRADRLGDWPFEIGLWVGRAAIPNVMGRKGDHNPDSARARTIAYKNDSLKPRPVPLEECPWCGTRFTPNAFHLVPDPDQPADPYLTLLGYFNSLRELGGSRRIVEDEVRTRLAGYAARRRAGEAEGPFAERQIAYGGVGLTSRVGTDQVAAAKRRLAVAFPGDGRVDVAIATNMISVGLDIPRLGLMVVLGQPKTSPEYVQATSRVGRDPDRPGLVVTILNAHRARDRSHYERFAFYHQPFYRSVEATSVTPFSPRALDRGLAGTLVALARQGHPPLTPPRGAGAILQERGRLGFVTEALAARAAAYAATPEEAQELRHRVRERAADLPDEWSRIAHEYQALGVNLQYQAETGDARPLLYRFLDPELKRQPLHARRGAGRQPVGPDARQHRGRGRRRLRPPAPAGAARRTAAMPKPRAHPHGQIRHSQVVTTFGPGSLLDLPTLSVLVGGLDHWAGVGVEVHEPRLVAKLQRLLGLPALKLDAPPPDAEDPAAPRTGITAWQFPEWFITQDVEAAGRGTGRARLLVHRRALTRGQFIDLDPRRRAAVQAWLARPAAAARGRCLRAGFEAWLRQHPQSRREFPGLPSTR